ncbi:hypothetical protein OPKNFCMD_5067 [Methylobacterium crusticola]|uniref:Uncharacterized protein n=1 Tax=Methylobacterium crusticola TaxID=1697972 RepID=A0ABQ4R4B7_9HYPH|nr:hypothetical protein OPKNFCMD_5067 [Methylobacterium crusticola]
MTGATERPSCLSWRPAIYTGSARMASGWPEIALPDREVPHAGCEAAASQAAQASAAAAAPSTSFQVLSFE